MKYYIDWQEYTPMGTRLPSGQDVGTLVQCHGRTVIHEASEEDALRAWYKVAPKSRVLALSAA